MSKTDNATKQDLADLGASIRQEMRQEIAILRVDMKVMFDDMLGVLSDMMTRIDARFNVLEAAFTKQQKDIKRLENSRH